jgi:GNAT superfamily N-acetyltransferase
MSQFEREPAEFIVNPWVAERSALVAVQDAAIVAAALVVRYRGDGDVGESYRNVGEIRWLLYWPMTPRDNPHWADCTGAAQALLDACVSRLDGWAVSRQCADGSLPVFGVYGVPEQWPHVERLFTNNGFVHIGPTEELHLVEVAAIAVRVSPPLERLTVRRLVGMNGTRLAAERDGESIGYVEVEAVVSDRNTRHAGIADIGNLVVVEEHRRSGVATWLLSHAARWLRLNDIDQLVAYAWPEQTDLIAFLDRVGFQRLVVTKRGWERRA